MRRLDIKTREDVAEWYAAELLITTNNLYGDIEWLTLNLKDSAFDEIDELYDKHINEMEADEINHINK
mgnify:CR=1|jgi:hypothetical protein|tara:strand:- start:207 stop:410 length:204 start_codon:yes stop_codon:yes gene_type:complete